MTTIELKPEPTNSKLELSATASVKTNFSGHHMLSAAYFARRSAIIEKKLQG
ncbi:MAG: hypothetical protein C5S49_06235 [Candidatus Methanogaster sp.]|nr:MAG: hypothetical protein C5S49_06235 [ANME-2 cluster archaeon]